MRIVSLIPSATEIVGALGLAADLVGRSHECDYPRGVERLPACTAPKFPAEGTSYEIDERVKAILAEGLSVYRVDAELLRDLGPNVILTQSQCEVCAVSLRDVERAVCEWVESRPTIVSLEPNSLDDVFYDIARVAEALGVADRGAELQGAMRSRMDAIARRADALPAKPSVAVVEWIEPLMAAGNWMPELVTMAGGRNVFGDAGKHSPCIPIEAVAAADPDWIILTPCGFPIDRTRADVALLEKHDEWRSLRAVREGRVAIGDGNQFFNRPGPRLVESLEILAEIFHPAVFAFGHRPDGWQLLG
jgi:iron complex transport system substrate-binding protein